MKLNSGKDIPRKATY